ncbi:MAG: CTP synthase, partial [uncultured Phycisphaerae bacterium]
QRLRHRRRQQQRVRADLRPLRDRHPPRAEDDRGPRRQHAARRQGRRAEAGHAGLAALRQADADPPALPPPVRGRPEVRPGARAEGHGLQRQAPDAADHAGAGAAAGRPPVLPRHAGPPRADEPPAAPPADVPRLRKGRHDLRRPARQGRRAPAGV